jgi:hypothetical protein
MYGLYWLHYVHEDPLKELGVVVLKTINYGTHMHIDIKLVWWPRWRWEHTKSEFPKNTKEINYYGQAQKSFFVGIPIENHKIILGS